MRCYQVRALIAFESLAMSLAAMLAAAVPVIVGGLACAFVSYAALGSFVVKWPIFAMIIGATISWSALFLILLIPALAPLRDGPSTPLREQGL